MYWPGWKAGSVLNTIQPYMDYQENMSRIDDRVSTLGQGIKSQEFRVKADFEFPLYTNNSRCNSLRIKTLVLIE